MIVQQVCRTYWYSYSELSILLKDGWRVVVCNPIKDELEYVLEKEVEEP